MRDCRTNHWIDEFYDFLMRVGHSTGCHQDPRRSFKIGGFQFPVCARCSGMLFGYLIGLVLGCFIKIPLCVCVGMILVMFYDWYIQYLGIKESTNFRRCITGIMYGIGIMHIFMLILKKIIDFLVGKMEEPTTI